MLQLNWCLKGNLSLRAYIGKEIKEDLNKSGDILFSWVGQHHGKDINSPQNDIQI